MTQEIIFEDGVYYAVTKQKIDLEKETQGLESLITQLKSEVETLEEEIKSHRLKIEEASKALSKVKSIEISKPVVEPVPVDPIVKS